MGLKTDEPGKRIFHAIEKSENDRRHYRGLILSNGMKVLLVSDPDTDKAAASMDVNVGFNSDPDDLPGLAHFCEHMLFLGTKKYPKEDDYQKFINQHAGSCNAYTDCEHTNYHFDVGHEHLRGALDRFSQFFTCPLFDASCTDREVNAVNSEHEKNLMSDVWRVQMLDRATSDPGHVYAKFGTGRESLDELDDMVTDMFSDAVDKEVKVPKYETSPYRKGDMTKKCVSIPVKDIRLLVLSFPIPDLFDYYDSKPDHYISHLIGHEGPGSLLSELKSKGWVNSLLAGPSGGSRGFDFLAIQVDLTETGMGTWKPQYAVGQEFCGLSTSSSFGDLYISDSLNSEKVFKYIKLLKVEGPKEWIYDELSCVSAMSFNFKDKEKPSSYVSKISCFLNRYPLERVLTAGVLMKQNKPEIIEAVLSKLTPDNMKVAVLSQVYKGKTDLVEKWYGTDYALIPFEESVMEQWRNIPLNDKLRLPDRNEFIPSRLGLKEVYKNNPEIPRIIKVLLSTPINELFDDALNEYSYNADIAGLSYELKNTSYGMLLAISGYDDKQGVLLDKILSKITGFKIDPQRFNVLKELYQRNLQNFDVDQPYQHAIYYSQVLRSEIAWTKRQLYDALADLTIENLTKFIPVLLSQLHIETLCFGNLTRNDALSVDQIVVDTLKERSSTQSLLPSQLIRRRDVELPPGSAYVYKQKHMFREISAVQVYFQVGMQNIRENALLDLTAQIISEPFFNILRTKEQLGYIVHSSVLRSNGTQGLRFIIQSDRPPNYLEARTEAYINYLQDMLRNMPDCEFEKHKDALKTKKLEKPKKMKVQASKYWSEISSKQYMFERNQIEVDELSSVTKDDILKFYHMYLHFEAPKRAKLSLYILGKQIDDCPSTINVDDHNKLLDDGALQCPRLHPSDLVDDIAKFKSTLPLYPRLEPFMNLSEATIDDGRDSML